MRTTAALAPGMIFERLTVIADLGVLGGRRRSLCRCICGKQKTIADRHLRAGESRSCGCLQHDRRARHGNTRYGEWSSEYITWRGIIQRCEDPRSAAFAAYGGRGITLCERWRNSFQNFLEDVGRRPNPSMQLGRIDNNGGYTPENVRWETPKQNGRNKRSTRYITVGSETLAMAEWAERIGILPGTLRQRLSSGWTPEDAVTRPLTRKTKKCERNN